MQVVKKTAEYTIYQKRNARYAIKNANNKIVNGEEKVKILLAEDLIKLTTAAPAAPEEAASDNESEGEEAAAE